MKVSQFLLASGITLILWSFVIIATFNNDLNSNTKATILTIITATVGLFSALIGIFLSDMKQETTIDL